MNDYLDGLTRRKPPRTPQSLRRGGRGRALWAGVVSEWALRPDEQLGILRDACCEADLIDRMQEEVDEVGLVVVGGRGAKVSHPLLRELERHRALLQRLLAALGLEETFGDAGANAGRRLASSRWRKRG